MNPTQTSVACPTTPVQPDGSPHTIIGCGSTNVSGPDDEGLYDCLDCGIWFNPADEPTTCTALTGHLPGSDHRWQECPTYHDDEESR